MDIGYKPLCNTAKNLRDIYLKDNGANYKDVYTFIRDIFYYHGYDRIEKKDEIAQKDGHYPFVPFDPIHFLADFRRIIKAENLTPENMRFIDVGSGHGDKVFLAWWFFNFKVTGLEYTEFTHLLSVFLINKFTGKTRVQYPKENYTVPEDEIYHRDLDDPTSYSIDIIKDQLPIQLLRGDGKKFDYSNYDFIYTYIPIASTESLKELYESIFRTMKVGAYWYECSFGSLANFLRKKDVKFIGDSRTSSYLQKIDKNKVRYIEINRSRK